MSRFGVKLFLAENITSWNYWYQMKVGEKVAWYRAKAEHTQESLAAESKISRKRISEIESDKGSPSIKTLERLLKACRVTLSEFFRSDEGQRGTDPADKEVYEKMALILRSPEDRGFAIRTIEMIFNEALRSSEPKNRLTVKTQETRAAPKRVLSQ